MKKTNEKGITLITLVLTIIILLILASIGITSGNQTIDMAKYNQFKSELTTLQTKINEYNPKDNIGQKLSSSQEAILNTKEVSDIIYKGKTEEEKTKIKDGFTFVNSYTIQSQLGLDGINRDYLINVEYRYIVSCEGVEYKGTTYYMIEQIDNGLYNVNYNNKNSETGSFELSSQKVGNQWKITVSNIEHEGYVSNWQVKYKLAGDEAWKSTENLEKTLMYGNGTIQNPQKDSIADKMATLKGWNYVAICILYWVIVYYQLKFFILYFKRVLSVGFLIIISPLISITYPIDSIGDEKAQGYQRWLEEILINIFIQPLHLVLYSIFITSAGAIATVAPLFAAIFLVGLSRGEKIVKNIFGIRGAQSISSLGGIHLMHRA